MIPMIPRTQSPYRGRWLALLTLVGAAVTGPTAEAAESAAKLPPLTTVSGNPRLAGKFVWADLVTDDVPRAQAFYGSLFRWSFRDYGGYLIAANDERPLCGMFQKPRPEGKPEAKPRWIGYISVPNLKKTERAVTSAGGRVLAAPRNFPERGEQAIFSDAEGALFGVIKSSSGDPEDFLAEPGDWIWIQLLSRDARKAAEFYRGIGRYEIIENSADGRMSDFVLASDGYARATVRTIPVDRGAVPAWLPFVRVSAVTESVAQAKQLGGTVLLEPNANVLGGKVAVVADPTGAAIGLLEWSDDAVKGGR